MNFALNRVSVPHLTLPEFLAHAKIMGFGAVEVRNDLDGGHILDQMDPHEVKELCNELKISIITINALQRFNDRKEFITQRVEELKEMVNLASRAGIEAIVLCPVNDEDESRTPQQRIEDTAYALKAYEPIFKEGGVIGLLEPLGFEYCSLRTKKEAIEAIALSGVKDLYYLVHDTFHHYLSGEQEIYPELTSLVHMSGVVTKKEKSKITDADRVLVTSDDIMSNVEQIKQLYDAGYEGFWAFECFSKDVHDMEIPHLAQQIEESLALITRD
ncbi:MAG: TIM barrel protein [Sphaerochaetaceae bacterium]|jgi:2-keto-myo-inositol isomerase